MPSNLLLLPLLGGYWFIHSCYVLRFRAYRMDGYRLLLDSSFAGVIFAAVARASTLAIPLSSPIRLWWRGVAGDQAFAGTAVIAFCVAVISPYAVNLFVSWRLRRLDGTPFQWRKSFLGIEGRSALGRAWNVVGMFLEPARSDALARTVKRWGTDLDRLLHEASLRATSAVPVMISLDNRKVYVGLVARSPDLRPGNQFFELLPIMSGYRDDTDLRVHFVTFYPIHRVDLSLALAPDLFTTFPVESVRSAHFFDTSLYQSHFGGELNSEPPASGG